MRFIVILLTCASTTRVFDHVHFHIPRCCAPVFLHSIEIPVTEQRPQGRQRHVISREIAFAFHVYIQKSIEKRFRVSMPLEVQACVLYYISVMRCEVD